MNRKYTFIVLGLSVAAVGAYLLKNTLKQKNTYVSLLDKAGIADQMAEGNSLLENAKMISEGSSYGVHYYNKLQEEDIS